MPPRKKKVGGGKDGGGGGGGGGGVLSALGGLGKKKVVKEKKPPKPHGGLVQTLGWLWRMGKPLPRPLPPTESAPKNDYDDDEDEEPAAPPPLRPLPSFLVLSLVLPGGADEFKVVGLKKNHALLEVSSSLRVGEVRVRVRDFLSEWQELQDEKKVEKKGGEAAKEPGTPGTPSTPATPAEGAKAAEPKAKSGKKEMGAKKGKKGKTSKGGDDGAGDGAELEKLVAPEPMLLMSGRRAWADTVRLGAALAQIGASSDSGAAGDGDAWFGRLPWADFGPEVMRYGPVVIVLDTMSLEKSEVEGEDAVEGGGPPLKGDAAATAKAPAKIRGTSTLSGWLDASGRTHLAAERPPHLVAKRIDERKRPDLSGAHRAAALGVAGGWPGFDPRLAYDPMAPFHPERGAESKEHPKLQVWPALTAKEHAEDEDNEDFDASMPWGHQLPTGAAAAVNSSRNAPAKSSNHRNGVAISPPQPSDLANKMRKPLGFGGRARIKPQTAQNLLDRPSAAMQ